MKHPLITALLLARNAKTNVTYKEAKALLNERHMCRAFGLMNELATGWYDETGDADLFSHVHNGNGPGKGFYLWKARASAAATRKNGGR